MLNGLKRSNSVWRTDDFNLFWHHQSPRICEFWLVFVLLSNYSGACVRQFVYYCMNLAGSLNWVQRSLRALHCQGIPSGCEHLVSISTTPPSWHYWLFRDFSPPLNWTQVPLNLQKSTVSNNWFDDCVIWKVLLLIKDALTVEFWTDIDFFCHSFYL